MENMTAAGVFPLKSECTFYQSEIFSEQAPFAHRDRRSDDLNRAIDNFLIND